MGMRIAAAVATLFFAMAVAVQYNDPDALRWMLLYGAPAVLSLAVAVRGLYFPRVSAVLAAAFLVLVLAMLPHLSKTTWAALASAGMSSEEQELVREGWGLAICFAWTALLAWVGWPKRGLIHA